MEQFLNITPGSVSVMGLMNDKEKQAFWNEFIELNSKCRIA